MAQHSPSRVTASDSEHDQRPAPQKPSASSPAPQQVSGPADKPMPPAAAQTAAAVRPLQSSAPAKPWPAALASMPILPARASKSGASSQQRTSSNPATSLGGAAHSGQQSRAQAASPVPAARAGHAGLASNPGSRALPPKAGTSAQSGSSGQPLAASLSLTSRTNMPSQPAAAPKAASASVDEHSTKRRRLEAPQHLAPVAIARPAQHVAKPGSLRGPSLPDRSPPKPTTSAPYRGAQLAADPCSRARLAAALCSGAGPAAGSCSATPLACFPRAVSAPEARSGSRVACQELSSFTAIWVWYVRSAVAGKELGSPASPSCAVASKQLSGRAGPGCTAACKQLGRTAGARADGSPSPCPAP